jgi:hypothetical protein
MNAIVRFNALHFHVLLDEANKCRALHFHRLPIAIVQRQDKVEKVALAQVIGRLLFEVSSRQADHTTGILMLLLLLQLCLEQTVT